MESALPAGKRARQSSDVKPRAGSFAGRSRALSSLVQDGVLDRAAKLKIHDALLNGDDIVARAFEQYERTQNTAVITALSQRLASNINGTRDISDSVMLDQLQVASNNSSVAKPLITMPSSHGGGTQQEGNSSSAAGDQPVASMDSALAHGLLSYGAPLEPVRESIGESVQSSKGSEAARANQHDGQDIDSSEDEGVAIAIAAQRQADRTKASGGKAGGAAGAVRSVGGSIGAFGSVAFGSLAGGGRVSGGPGMAGGTADFAARVRELRNSFDAQHGLLPPSTALGGAKRPRGPSNALYAGPGSATGSFDLQMGGAQGGNTTSDVGSDRNSSFAGLGLLDGRRDSSFDVHMGAGGVRKSSLGGPGLLAGGGSATGSQFSASMLGNTRSSSFGSPMLTSIAGGGLPLPGMAGTTSTIPRARMPSDLGDLLGDGIGSGLQGVAIGAAHFKANSSTGAGAAANGSAAGNRGLAMGGESEGEDDVVGGLGFSRGGGVGGSSAARQQGGGGPPASMLGTKDVALLHLANVRTSGRVAQRREQGTYKSASELLQGVLAPPTRDIWAEEGEDGGEEMEGGRAGYLGTEGAGEDGEDEDTDDAFLASTAARMPGLLGKKVHGAAVGVMKGYVVSGKAKGGVSMKKSSPAAAAAYYASQLAAGNASLLSQSHAGLLRTGGVAPPATAPSASSLPDMAPSHEGASSIYAAYRGSDVLRTRAGAAQVPYGAGGSYAQAKAHMHLGGAGVPVGPRGEGVHRQAQAAPPRPPRAPRVSSGVPSSYAASLGLTGEGYEDEEEEEEEGEGEEDMMQGVESVGMQAGRALAWAGMAGHAGEAMPGHAQRVGVASRGHGGGATAGTDGKRFQPLPGAGVGPGPGGYSPAEPVFPDVLESTSVSGINLPVYQPTGPGWVGAYPPEKRLARLERFLYRRQHRVWEKIVKYDVRKSFADSRLRVKGRFVKKEDEALLRDFMQLV